ncbi:MAG: galactose oxidase-like domain-containing protein, partial [Capsulimonadales bacterium]|nr:galactose oxidase-like domain-containing protein [Capsulimonadales bacterium]
QMNATLLPDGLIFVTGGVRGAGFNDMTTPVLSSEVWDPVTEQFTTWASMAVGRWYHSTVVLLPDGRLLSAGGDNNLNAEIFSPPYLFQGPRPVITSAPGLVRYGATFDVETPDASKVTNANWIRLSSVTHARNFDQRINRLSFQATATGLRVTAPSDPNLCPPGYYMLFLLNEKGVPSVARIQRIGDGVLTVTPPTNLTAVPGAGQVSLNWSASPEALAYTIKRGTRKGGPYSTTVARGVTTTSYTDTGLANDKTYHYVVIATNGNLESVPSSPVSAKPRTLPAAPTGLTATATSGTRIALSWVDNATNEQGFYIERSTDGVTFAQIARVGPNARTYGNGGLPRKTRYSYRVRAYNATGPSGYSDIASATTN